MSFDEIFDLTAGAYFHVLYTIGKSLVCSTAVVRARPVLEWERRSKRLTFDVMLNARYWILPCWGVINGKTLLCAYDSRAIVNLDTAAANVIIVLLAVPRV